MQGKGLISTELVFRVISRTGKLLESSQAYTGLKDCVKGFNSIYQPTEEVSYSKAYRNIRVYGFHTEAIQYHAFAPGKPLVCAIAIFTGVKEAETLPREKAPDLFSRVEGQVKAGQEQASVFSSVEEEATHIYAEWERRAADMLDSFKWQVDQIAARRGKGSTQKAAKVLKQGSTKKVSQGAKKPAKKATKPGPGIHVYDLDKGEGLEVLPHVKTKKTTKKA